ncbi:MAG: hypothetical protein KF726_04300 [Anaerolineae bacterium]|nr:hypothetical protein [Anaerolineae bacterium]
MVRLQLIEPCSLLPRSELFQPTARAKRLTLHAYRLDKLTVAGYTGQHNAER